MTDLPRLLGRGALLQKSSAVDRDGALRLSPIDGVIVRRTRPVPHEDGTLTEIARASWPELAQPIVHTHVTSTLAGRVRAWGLHQRSTDRLFVVSGLVSIVIFDGRLDSKTFGCLNELKLSERNPSLVIIPPNLFHGWKNLGTCEAWILNMPSAEYEHELPDALDLPYESDAARELVPFRW